MGSHFGWNSFLDHSRVFYYEKAPRDEDETHQPSSAEDISTGLIEDLAYIISGNENGHVWPCASGIRVKDDGSDSEVQQEAADHIDTDTDSRIMVGNIRSSLTISKIPGMRLVGLRGDACNYYSSSSLSQRMPIIEIYYRLNGDRYPSHGKNPNGKRYVELQQGYEIVQFRYHITSGRATYILACSQQAYRQYVASLKQNLFSKEGRIHPFAIHLILLGQIIIARGVRNDNSLRRLMMLEEQYLRGDSTVTYEEPDETKHQLQALHGLLLDLAISANENKRHLASIEHLLQALGRVKEMQQSVAGAYMIDPDSHQRLEDGFRSLKDFCENRGLRLASRQQRAQNLVSLSYNLLANRDSKVNLDIATDSRTISKQSAAIAFEARQDGAAMMTIAVLGMIFLPATFVASLLGSNLFALEDNGAGRHSFVVSELWWLYLVSAIPLTLVTFGAWGCWLWRRKKRLDRGRRREMAGLSG